MTDIPATGYFSDVARTNGEAKTAQDDTLEILRELPGGAATTELTIAAGSVTPVAGIHTIDTEGDAAADDLTIIDQTNVPDGRLLMISAADAARVTTVKHGAGGAGQVLLADSADLVLNDTTIWLVLKRLGTTWVEVMRSYGNAKAAARAYLGLGDAALGVIGTDVAAMTGSKAAKEGFTIGLSDETSDLAVGTAKLTWRPPYAFTATEYRINVVDAPTGSTIIVDVNEGGVSVLSTKLTIDAGEKTSTSAAVPAVISDANIADDGELTFDIDQVGSTVAGVGLKIAIIGYKT